MGYKTKIDWCDSSWNPVTGCLHGCEYCYARGIAKRYGGYNIDPVGESVTLRTFNGQKIVELENQVNRVDKNHAVRIAPYPYGFTPTLHRYRLDQPTKWSEPRTIFVCSMADLFGEWVPHEWIYEVFRVCKETPQHRYLFLTKNPKRYSDLLLRSAPDNAWLGASYTGIGIYERTSAVKHRFLSIEPLLNRIPPLAAHTIALWNDWVIIGAETGTRKGKVKPEKEWIDTIVRSCDAVGTPVFMKESLREIMSDDFRQEFPWEVDGR